MEQNRPKQTDQQATNAALAALAAAGNAFALGQLWEVNKGFVRRQLWQWYEKNQTVADSAGLSFEDLVQEGYFAVDYAAKHYSAEQGSFTTYLSYALLKQIRTATCGEHTRGVITEDGRRVAVSANPLNECTSLDTPVGEDGSDTALGDLQEDPAAAHEFQQAENEIYNEESRRTGRSLEQAGRPRSGRYTPPLLQRPEPKGHRAGYRHIQQPREPNRTARLPMPAQYVGFASLAG